ncbi:uncharacterized protein LOC129002421 [Macrosteles quadrilineatus]|uniref:uncharacterized protein LOC129002266 n=1 Tax=Macrosteles quadrilineatus TaxID=74068 RepID=UPI0023E1245B|nr:uncharacterized protein LOC129002266 [Macrosteles quadrilineatus]XP_054286179.1 uncharacterized protein LOC129002421 [Macrosteles quadrilineatus]
MRTAVAVAFFALLSVALAASVQEKKSDQSQYKSAKSAASEGAESLAVADAFGNKYVKATTEQDASASTREGSAKSDSYKYADAFGNKVQASKTKKSVSASDNTSSASTSYEAKVAAPKPCGCL